MTVLREIGEPSFFVDMKNSKLEKAIEEANKKAVEERLSKDPKRAELERKTLEAAERVKNEGIQ